jgi:serine protease AprX
MSIPKRCCRKSGLAVLAILAVCIGTAILTTESLLSDSGNHYGRGKLDPALDYLNEAMLPQDQAVDVIVQFDDDALSTDSSDQRNQKKLARRQAILDAGGQDDRDFDNFPFHSGKLSFKALKQLQNNPKVKRISVNHPVHGVTYTTARAIGADQAWGSTYNPGYDGTGITVAVLDSGVYNLGDMSRKVVAQQDFVDNSNLDWYGHGSHVSATIVGTGANSSPGSGHAVKYMGVAPGAKVIGVRVLGSDGSGSTSDVISGIDWVISHKSTYNIRVINLSLGHPVFESYKTDPLCQAVERAVAHGIVVVVAAGNFGSNADGTTVYGGITSPANDPAVITVGAVDTHGTIARSDDTIASYSSRGPTAIDGLIKPDIVAPGNKVIAYPNRYSNLYLNNPSNRVYPKGSTNNDKAYLLLSGTSVAAPVVSGTVALMLDANPSLEPNAVKAILAYTAQRMKIPNILEQGNGYVNAEGAVRLACAISAYSNSLRAGVQWISKPSSIKNYSTISGESVLWGDAVLWGDSVLWGDGVLWGDSVLWGDGVLWGDSVLWGDGVLWGDSLMKFKQKAFSDSVLWGDGLLWGDSIQVSGSTILKSKGSTGSLRGITSATWYPNFVDPTSMGTSADTTLLIGTATSALRTGPLGAWFYPPMN